MGGVAVAVGISVLGGVAVAVAPLLGVVVAATGTVQGGQPLAALWGGLLSIAVPLLGLLLLHGGRVLGAVGVLGGWGAAGLGAAVLDVQLFTRPIDANRLELFRPTSAAALGAGAGAVTVLVGHLLVAVAGALALWAAHRSALLDDPDGLDIGLLVGVDVESRGRSLASRAGSVVTVIASVAAIVTAAALFAAPLTSTDPVILVSAVVQAASPIVFGSALLAVAALVVVALALVSTNLASGAGAVAGVALGVLAVCSTRLLAAAADARVDVGWGSALGTASTLVLIGCAAVFARSRRGRRRGPAAGPVATEIQLPSLARMHLLTGVLGLLAAVAAVVAALLPTLSTPPAVPIPQIYSVRVLLIGGVVLAAVSVGLLTGGVAEQLRPVVAIVWVAPLLGAGGVLQAVLVATSVPGVGAGAGAWVTVLAVLLACGCGISAGLAGAVEREEVDTSGEFIPTRGVQVSTALAAGTAVLGFAFPLYSGSGVTAAALFVGSWGWDSWGLVVVAVAVLGAVQVAARARRIRALALLGGVALVLAVHLVSWPLTAVRLAHSGVGLGSVFGLLALVAAATMAAVLTRAPTSAPEVAEAVGR